MSFLLQNGQLKASGIYVNELRDSTWNYYNFNGTLILSEQYKSDSSGFKKVFYEDGNLFEIQYWKEGEKTW